MKWIYVYIKFSSKSFHFSYKCFIFFYHTGAIFGALQDILGSRSVSKDYYNQTGRIPDWCSLNNPPLEMMFDVGKNQPPLMKRAFSTEK